MSRWIDYDAINYRHGKIFNKSDEFLNGVVYMAQRIEEAPSIEIVRCKECRYFYTEERFGETVHFCKHFNDVRGYWAKIYADDFCSYGKVSEKLTSSERSNE